MQTTDQLIERIYPRYEKARNKNLEFLWEDFLGAVEKVVEQVSDEILAATTDIIIFYYAKLESKEIYRSRRANCNEQILEYEKEDICLGTQGMLEIAFGDFKIKAKEDKNICTDWFDVQKLFNTEDSVSTIMLDFLLPARFPENS